MRSKGFKRRQSQDRLAPEISLRITIKKPTYGNNLLGWGELCYVKRIILTWERDIRTSYKESEDEGKWHDSQKVY